jgi:hypothetical protein
LGGLFGRHSFKRTEAFGDPDKLFWMVMRTADKTPFLSRDEERVPSVIPREYATDATKIRLAARVPERQVHKILERLIVRKFVEAFEGLRAFRITTAGLEHPQRAESARCARAPRLPVESDRVYNVLSTISVSGKLRTRDIANILRLPPQSINALVQYRARSCLTIGAIVYRPVTFAPPPARGDNIEPQRTPELREPLDTARSIVILSVTDLAIG